MGEQFKIIEYPLIIIFIITGGVFLISTSDLVSIFLSIELQSYGLYLLSTIYRDSEPATSGGLMYFLLGGLSSCFILLGTALLYGNSGTTNLESLYIITSISNVSKDNLTGLLYWYESYYIHISLLFMGVGFLFKVSAAPFHFWSPDGWSGKSSKSLLSWLRGQLSNSGNSLELKVPNYCLKPMCEWTNDSCEVTTLKTSEKKVGYRGSKSVTRLSLNNFFVNAIFFICLIIYLSVLHSNFLLYLNYSLLAILYLSKKLYYLYRLNFSSTSGLLIHGKHSITALFSGKHLVYKSDFRKLSFNKLSRSYSTNSSSITPSLQPVSVYINADQDKVLILKENKGKCGVYRWINLINGKSYIGSSIDLHRRLKCYYNIYFLESGIKNRKSLIYSSLLKYGYSNFSLEILEYCSSSEAISREQYYIDLLKPAYNILLVAGSRLGSKHSEETKAKISAAGIGNQNSAGSKGRKRAEGAGSPSVPIEVLDLETGLKTIYPSMSAVGEALSVPAGSIRMYFSRNNQNPYKGRYVLQKLV